MGNSRVRRRFELALDAKQAVALAVGTTVLVGAVFVLGMNVGRRGVAAAQPPIAAPTLVATKDPLARLDEPLPAREEPAVELKAHQVLTDARPIDKALPVPQVKAAAPVAAAPAPDKPPRDGAAPAPARPPRESATPAPTRTTPVAAASPKAARPADAEPARKKGAYAIQVASLPTRGDAEKVAQRHRTRRPRIVQADVPGKGRHYRVLVGSFESADAAKRALASLTRSGVQGIVTAVR